MRAGRLWQTLILSHWNPLFAFLPVETVIRNRHADYYRALGTCDKAGNSTAFIEFLLATLLTVLREVSVTDPVKALLKLLRPKPLSALESMQCLNLSHRPTFRANYLHPALEQDLIERTIPDKTNSRLQKYRLTAIGGRIKVEGWRLECAPRGCFDRFVLCVGDRTSAFFRYLHFLLLESRMSTQGLFSKTGKFQEVR